MKHFRDNNVIGYDSSVIELAYRLANNIEVPPTTFSLIPEAPLRVVLDGFFRVNDNFSALECLYWSREGLRIRRGTWFTHPEQIPLPDDQSEEIELKSSQVSERN